MKHHTKRSGCQSNAQKKRKYRHIKRETKLNIARRVDSTAFQCYDAEDSLLSNSNDCHALEDAVNIPEIDATNWIGSLSAIPLAFIPTAFSGMYKRCVWAVGQSFEKAKDVVFPSFKIRRELESTQLKLIQLEQSLERILQEKETKTDVTCNCCCAKSPCDSMLNSSSTSTKSSNHSRNLTALPIPPSFAPPLSGFVPPTPCIVPPPPSVAPPPPGVAPPPPPPPPPPPVKEVKEFKLVINKAKKRDRETTKKDENGFHISANDLRKVKLRKINSYERKKTPESGFTGRMGRPLVSLNDLQKVKLRRLSLGSNLSPKSQVVLRKRLPQEAVAFRNSLKKVEIARSPGGTPYRKQIQDTGTGLTPLMARALKRKFKKARTPSPIPMNKLTSPSSPKPVKPVRI